MSDFAQTGLISTLQRLDDSHLPALEAELVELSRSRPIALVLPCHGRDLQQPAFDRLVEELRGAKFLEVIVLSLNGIEPDAFRRLAADSRFRSLPQRTMLLWNDELPGSTLPAGGKGRNVSAAFRALAEEGRCAIVATQDCDVASFRRVDLARLCYPIAQPSLGYHFAKAYYSRATDRLYGRVSRLFVTPLLQALVRVAGHQPLLDFLLSFRYPLAGEAALTLGLATTLPMSAGWGLEIGQLCEVFRRVDPRAVCQVDGGSGYEHKHQPADTSLAFMAAEIAQELFRQLTVEGLLESGDFHPAIASAFQREAAAALRRSAHLARINGLPFDDASEESLVAIFAEILLKGESPSKR